MRWSEASLGGRVGAARGPIRSKCPPPPRHRSFLGLDADLDHCTGPRGFLAFSGLRMGQMLIFSLCSDARHVL